MAFDVSALAAYTEEKGGLLIRDLVTGSRTAGLVTKQSGIKFKEALNLLTTTITFQDGSACGFTASGDDTYTQRIIEVCPITVQKEWCPRDLEQKWTQALLNAGSNYDDWEPEAILVDLIMESIKTEIETVLWQGDTAGAGNLALCDGYLKVIDAAAGVVNATSVSLGAGNVIDVFQEMYELVPSEVLGNANLRFFIGDDTSRLYKNALTEANLFHFMPDPNEESFVVHNTGIRAEVVTGLNGTNRIICATTDNLFMGTDLENEEEQMKVWYSNDDDVVRMRVDWKQGAQIAFPEFIVEFTSL